MSTIIDVAERAGVSKSTVSRVLTGGPVSDYTRERVLAAMQALNYQPNAVARGLVRKRSQLIGVLISDVADPYYSAMLRGMEACALDHQYDLLIYSTLWEPERELAYMRRLTERRVDGVVIVGGRDIPDKKVVHTYLQLAGEGRPLVFIDRGLGNVAIPVVEIDNFSAAKEVVKHLIELGHEQIAHIAGPLDVVAAQARAAGYRAALQEAGFPIRAQLLMQGDFQKASGAAATRQMLALSPPPTAVFAANDLMALGAWQAAMSEGLSVPADLALVGFDDIELLSLAEVPLTTVRQPRYRMGQLAVETLVRIITVPDNPLPEPVATLPTELVIRASCGARPGVANSSNFLSDLRTDPA